MGPEGRFITYGIGFPLIDMPSPELGRAVVPVDCGRRKTVLLPRDIGGDEVGLETGFLDR
jgi:hypothetical protein